MTPASEPARREVVVMVTTSYPRFPGDTIGTFMEPIAREVARRGHEVHVVLPWHPQLRRGPVEDGVRFHPFRYAPLRSLNVFGYAAALREDVSLRLAAWMATPLALAAGWRKARKIAPKFGATVMHAHWVVPGGVMGALAAPRLPLVISLHGSDVYVAERHAMVGRAARWAFGRAGFVTACSDDLRERAIRLGAARDRSETIPYGVDADRFRPDPAARAARRAAAGLASRRPRALHCRAASCARRGSSTSSTRRRSCRRASPHYGWSSEAAGTSRTSCGRGRRRSALADRVSFPGVLGHAEVAEWLAAADVAVVPSVRDDSGNVDGLPNVVMEALASGDAAGRHARRRHRRRDRGRALGTARRRARRSGARIGNRPAAGRARASRLDRRRGAASGARTPWLGPRRRTLRGGLPGRPQNAVVRSRRQGGRGAGASVPACPSSVCRAMV